MPFEIFSRTYSLPAGETKVNIHYWRTFEQTLDFDLVAYEDQLTLSYGYEDDDLLVFYPNGAKFVFDDIKKFNFRYIKLSLDLYGAGIDPVEKFKYGGVEIFRDNVKIFEGIIDTPTVDYNEDEMTTTFEALSKSSILKDMPVERHRLIDVNGVTFPDNTIMSLTYPLYGIFKIIWQDFTAQVYDASHISSNLIGTFIRHDWRFTGRRINPFNEITKDWTNVQQFVETLFNFDSTGLFSADRPGRTWADFIRIIAQQFAVTIGVEDYGKVYFAKRFGTSGRTPVDISNSIVENNLSIKIYLPPLRGVRVVNTWSGERHYDYGIVETEDNGQFKYPNYVRQINTYVGSFSEGNLTGTAIYAGSSAYPVLTGVRDPDLGVSGFHAYQVTAQWYMNSRSRSKSMVETTLDGIDYSMIGLYKVTAPDSNITVNLRPMTMEKSYTLNQTKLVGIEI